MMIIRLIWLKFLLLLFFINSVHGQVSEVRTSSWKGFKRYDFTLDQRNVRLVLPNKPISGNPWIWRARFPDWHTESDSILISEGFHLLHINTGDEYGSPKAMEAWDAVYEYVTKEYGLNARVALVGVSRGGLFVYNWAKKHPDKISCIYAEAPVCDFKSWPMGKHGKRSDEDWNKLKIAYGFQSDKAAMDYSNNPIDNLEALAREQVPILHMIGLQDIIVPPEENTFVLVDQYLKLGGIATVVPCTKGEQKLEGHHFDIQTPRYVADFIKYHTRKYLALNASDYHNLADGLKNSQIQFERNKSGRVAFLGGSITYNGGWRDSLMVYFKDRFKETSFDFIAAGISSMGTTPSAFRLQRDVLSKGPVDLLFVEAAVNDETNGRSSEEQIRAMEGIIRNLRKSNPAIDVVVMHFVDPDKMAVYREGGEPAVIKNHNRVADHYRIPTINLAREVTDRIDNKEFTWENDFVNLHPSPFGQGVYANSMIKFLNKAYSGHIDANDKIYGHTMPAKLDPLCYDNGKLIDISTLKPAKGWLINSSWVPNDGTGTRPNYTNVPMLISQTPGSSISIKFTGNVVGIAVAAGQDAGTLEYRIDQGDWQEQNLFTRWSKQLHLPWYYTLATGLSDEKHKLELRVSSNKDPQSTGNACRIRYVFVNETIID